MDLGVFYARGLRQAIHTIVFYGSYQVRASDQGAETLLTIKSSFVGHHDNVLTEDSRYVNDCSDTSVG